MEQFVLLINNTFTAIHKNPTFIIWDNVHIVTLQLFPDLINRELTNKDPNNKYNEIIPIHNHMQKIKEVQICLDIEQLRKRTPDDVAKDIIFDTCKCNSAADFQKLSLSDRDKYLVSIHKKCVSIRQLNRLTGTPRGVIERIIRRSWVVLFRIVLPSSPVSPQ